PLTGILPGKGVDALAEQAIGYGLDRVIVVDDPILEIYRSRPYAQVMAQLIRRHKPEIVLFGASKNGRDLGGRLHAILETGLAADCVKFDIDAEGNLDMIRPSFGGKSLARIRCFLHRMWARLFPPKLGRIMSRLPSASMSNLTQSAASPVSRIAWRRPPRSRPFFEAPKSTISGLCLRMSCAITWAYGRDR